MMALRWQSIHVHFLCKFFRVMFSCAGPGLSELGFFGVVSSWLRLPSVSRRAFRSGIQRCDVGQLV